MLRARIADIPEPTGEPGRAARIVNGLLLALIAVNLVALVLESVADVHRRAPGAFRTFEVVPRDLRGGVRAAAVVVLVPLFLPLVDLRSVRVLRLFRLFRIAKVARMIALPTSILGAAFAKELASEAPARCPHCDRELPR